MQTRLGGNNSFRSVSERSKQDVQFIQTIAATATVPETVPYIMNQTVSPQSGKISLERTEGTESAPGSTYRAARRRACSQMLVRFSRIRETIRMGISL